MTIKKKTVENDCYGGNQVHSITVSQVLCKENIETIIDLVKGDASYAEKLIDRYFLDLLDVQDKIQTMVVEFKNENWTEYHKLFQEERIMDIIKANAAGETWTVVEYLTELLNKTNELQHVVDEYERTLSEMKKR